jgi:hypothetical protein
LIKSDRIDEFGETIHDPALPSVGWPSTPSGPPIMCRGSIINSSKGGPPIVKVGRDWSQKHGDTSLKTYQEHDFTDDLHVLGK